ncbi:MAG: PEP-CTERM sorting domain-containing protein [Planctomycetota bacterium]
MNPRPIKLAAVIIILATLCPALTAKADFINNLARGLSLFDYQFRGERNVLGDGWTIQTGATYDNRTFDFGVAQLTLTGQVAGEVGYTLRGIPKGDFVLNTGATPLAYEFKINNGIQNYVGTGSALIDIDTSINALGFYNQSFHISNRGEYELSGLVQDTGTLDYDIGPINVSGNIFLDIIAALTQPFFAATGTQNPFAALSDRTGLVAGMTETIEELSARLTSGETLNERELGTMVNNAVLASMLGSPQLSSTLFQDLLLPADLLEDLETAQANGLILESAPIPEPATISLMALGLIVGISCYRRKR